MASSIALQGLMHGSRRIPDGAFEKIPVVGPKYFKEAGKDDDTRRKHQQRDRRRSRRDDVPSESDSYDSERESDYERERRARRSHRRSAKDGRRVYDRGYDSDPESPTLTRGFDDRSRNQDDRSRREDVRSGQYNEAPRGYDNSPYFPPPPKIAIDEPQVRNQGPQGSAFIPRPYNPTDYDEDTGARDNYYSGHPQEQAPYTPPVGPPPSQQSTNAPSSIAPTRDPDAYSRSSVSDRYRPSNADQYAPMTADRRYERGSVNGSREEHGSPRLNYSSAVAIRPQSHYYPSQDSLSPTYQRYDDWSDDDEHERRPRRKDSKSRSKSRGSRSRSKVAEVREKAKDGFKEHKGELEAGALGVVAGGLLGREFGGKKGNLGMAIGAALGGLGAGLYSKHQEKQKEKSRDRSRSRGRSGSVRRDYAGYESY